MKIQITIGEQALRRHPRRQRRGARPGRAAARDDRHDRPRRGREDRPAPAPLSLEGQPEGADPDVGDLGYYAPGNDLVLYYGDQSYFPGIVILGRLDGDAAQRIAEPRRPRHRDGRGTVTDLPPRWSFGTSSTT